jgi:hypothetical protein
MPRADLPCSEDGTTVVLDMSSESTSRGGG